VEDTNKTHVQLIENIVPESSVYEEAATTFLAEMKK
jgi:hypothetical protein